MKHKKLTRALKDAPQTVRACHDCQMNFPSKYEAKQHAKRTGHIVSSVKP